MAALLATAGCRADPARPEIRIGVIGPFAESDPGARAIDPAVSAAVDLAFAELELEALSSGGADLGTLVAVYADDGATREGAAAAAHRLIATEQVVAIVGPGRSSTALAVSRVADAEQLPMLSAGSSHAETTANKPSSFRLGILASTEADALATLALGPLAGEHLAVLFEESDVFCRSIAASFRRFVDSRGAELVAYEPYVSGTTDFSEALERIRAARADVILLPNYLEDTRRQVKQIEQLRIDAELVGTDALDVTLLDADERTRALRDLEGMYIGLTWHPNQPGEPSRRFVERYRARTGTSPTVSSALHYEAVKILHGAINASASTEPDAVRRGLLAAGPFDTVLGSFVFSEDGEPGLVPTIFRVQNGEMRFFSHVPR